MTQGLEPQGPSVLPSTGYALELLSIAVKSHSQEAVSHPDSPQATRSTALINTFPDRLPRALTEKLKQWIPMNKV